MQLLIIVPTGRVFMEYLQEMRREVLDGRDTITVGECSGVTLEEALKYASCDGKELSMVFQFEHVDLVLMKREINGPTGNAVLRN